MTSKVSICNQALSLLGASMITSLEDNTNEAKLCALHYDNVRDAVLEANDWTFATKWFDLPPLADPPESEFANAYPLPPEVLRVIFVGINYEYPEFYRVESGNVVTDAANCRIQAIVSLDDPTQYSPLFIQAFAARLAAELAIPITNSRTLAEQHLRVFSAKVQEASSKDNQQGTSRRIRSRWLNLARRQSTRRAGPYV